MGTDPSCLPICEPCYVNRGAWKIIERTSTPSAIRRFLKKTTLKGINVYVCYI